MKTNIPILFIVILLNVAILSCNKEESYQGNSTGQNNANLPAVKSNTFKIPFIKNPYPIDKYLVNPSDAEDENINKQLYKIALAFKPFIKDNTFNADILEKAKLNINKAIKLAEFVENPKLISKRYDKNEVAFLKKCVSEANLIHHSKNPSDQLKRSYVEIYVPAIFIPNATTADPGLSPILSYGDEVNCELPGMESYEDYVVAWYYDENGNLIETLLSEASAMASPNPVYVIDNAEENLSIPDLNTFTLKSSSATILSPLSSLSWESHEYQINYRYENFGNSEFFITAYHITENALGWRILENERGEFCESKKIADVHKNNIGLLLTHTMQFNNCDVLPFSDNYTFFNTYERDWINSKKTLGQGTGNGKAVYLYGERKYVSEWYSFDPNITLPRVDYNNIYNSWVKWYDNTKSRFTIYRVGNI